MVIGSSFSANEIASEICLSAEKTNSSVRHPIFVIPRYVQISEKIKIPIDLFRNRRNILPITKVYTDKKEFETNFNSQNIISNKKLGSGSRQNLVSPILAVQTENNSDYVLFSISDLYLKYVEKDFIDIKSEIMTLPENGVIFKNEIKETEIDNILYCTGYKHDLSFLCDEILEKIEFSEKEPFLSII